MSLVFQLDLGVVVLLFIAWDMFKLSSQGMERAVLKERRGGLTTSSSFNDSPMIRTAFLTSSSLITSGGAKRILSHQSLPFSTTIS